MGKKLLPCPVCSGESFIESVTQGGLICTDCGAVSNQVEVADDDDPQMAPKTFIRSMTYKKVTEAESQAKRDRRVVLRHKDRRDISTILEGIGLILSHQIEALIDRGLCPSLSRVTVREVWFDFLRSVSESRETPVIISEKYSGKLHTNLASWGIPSIPAQREAVLKGLAERSKQHAALVRMLDERRIAHCDIVVVEDGPSLVFAHDWLLKFFSIQSLILPDYILHAFSAPFNDEWTTRVIEYELADTSDDITISSEQRRALINQLFGEITRNEKIRIACIGKTKCRELPLSIDVALTLPILIIGIRNAGGGVSPTHVLNWIARCDLPYFSAHKILPCTVDRIEFYRLNRSNHGYKSSIFYPSFAPLPVVVCKKLSQLGPLLHINNPNNPVGLIKTCLNMMGLDSLFEVSEIIIKKCLFEYIFEPEKPTFDKRMISQSSFLDPMINTDEKLAETCISDISVSELVAVVLAFVMKLVFPTLHDTPVHTVLEPHTVELTQYELQWRPSGPGNLAWWDSLGKDERGACLNFFENELFDELRESVAQDIKSLIKKDALPQSSGRSIVLVSGLVKKYQFGTDTTELMELVFKDILRVCELGRKNDIQRLINRLVQLETFYFSL